MRKRVILKIYGTVQGVFFRDSAKKKAQELNLSGFARNELDGTVSIVAEGEEKDLSEFIEWCKGGPDHAKVEKVETEWLEPTNQFNDFSIK